MAKSSFYSESGTSATTQQTIADLVGDAEDARDAALAAQAAAEASQTAAASSATSASTSASTATSAAADAAAALVDIDEFGDIYLGAFSAAPTVDNDGDPLLTGALYFDTDDNTMQTWTGSAWVTFTGPQGAQGPAGADGADGADGAAGAAGADGADGADGFGYVPLQNVSGSNTITAQGYVTQTAYVTGAVYMFKAVGTNSGSATLNVDSLGAKTIKKYGSNVGVGDLFAGTWYACLYDGTDMNLILSGASL